MPDKAEVGHTPKDSENRGADVSGVTAANLEWVPLHATLSRLSGGKLMPLYKLAVCILNMNRG